MIVPALMVFAAALGLGMTIEQSMVLEPSGGLRATYVYEIPNSAAGLLTALQLEVARRAGMAPSGGVLDEASARRQFAGIQGVYVENYSCIQFPDRQRVELSVKALDASAALASGAFGPFQYTPADTAGGGRLELAMPAEEMAKAMDPAHAERLAELIGGFQLILTITAPSAVREKSTGQPDGPMRRRWIVTLPSLLAREVPTVRLLW